MQFAWATDLHLDSVDPPDVARFCAAVRRSKATGLLISGDIAEANSVLHWLEYLKSALEIPIYFVLGNHDYYGSDIQGIELNASRSGGDGIFYVPDLGPLRLDKGIDLVGNGGWGDCRIGDLEEFVILTDYFAIDDLRETLDLEAIRAGILDRSALKVKLGELGDRAAEALKPQLIEASRSAESVIVLTHVPPFRESCWHGKAISHDAWLPGFTCKAIGDLLLSVAQKHENVRYTVLCGHTHGHGVAHVLPNLTVVTGHGEYGELHFSLVQFDGTRVSVHPPGLRA